MGGETVGTLFRAITARDTVGAICPCGLPATIAEEDTTMPGTVTGYYCSFVTAFYGHPATGGVSFLAPGSDVPREAPGGHAGDHAGPGRPRLWTSNADRQKAYRARQKKAGA